ncbi:MAG: SDR family oxidoreductase [Chitinophagaceae bacterium]|nr:SDR family oxidoreductase [Chitinophagaceae bacterium]
MLNNRIAIITGASKGIGKAVALRFAAHNYFITLVGRDQKELEETNRLITTQYKTESLVCQGDLADEEFLREIVDRTMTKWGRVDALINNAAWRQIETMRTISLTTWEKTIRICLTAPAFLAQYCASVMEKLAIQGVVINVSSIMSDRPGGISPAYAACKGALESLTYELAITYGRSGIRALCVRPGHIDTDMSRDYVDGKGEDLSSKTIGYLVDATPLGRGGAPAEVAEAIYWLCTDSASFITGATLTIDGGFSHNINSYAIKKLQFPNEFE